MGSGLHMQRKARWMTVQLYNWASWIDGDGVLLVFLTSMMMTIIMSLIGWDEVRFICKGRPGIMKIAGKDGDYMR